MYIITHTMKHCNLDTKGNIEREVRSPQALNAWSRHWNFSVVLLVVNTNSSLLITIMFKRSWPPLKQRCIHSTTTDVAEGVLLPLPQFGAAQDIASGEEGQFSTLATFNAATTMLRQSLVVLYVSTWTLRSSRPTQIS